MLNSGKKNKYSNSCFPRKKILNETKSHNPPPPPCKLNGWSLIHAFRMASFSVLADIGCHRYSVLSVNIHSLPLHSVCLVNL